MSWGAPVGDLRQATVNDHEEEQAVDGQTDAERKGTASPLTHSALRQHAPLRERLAQPEHPLAESFGTDRERDPEVAFATGAETAAGQHDHTLIIERPSRERPARGCPPAAEPRGTSWPGATRTGSLRSLRARMPASRRLASSAMLAGISRSALSSAKAPACWTASHGPVSTYDLTRVSAPMKLAFARDPADPPAGHREALGEREELDRDVARPGDLEDARRHVAVEGQIAVGIVVGQHDPVLRHSVDQCARGNRAARRPRSGCWDS